jgi:ribonucleoside-diphosphate reductase beta chain
MRQRSSLAGLDPASPALRLYRQAKALGTWDPDAIDLSRDVEEWQSLSDDERDLLLRVTSLFQAGEETVVIDLVPLLLVIGREGRFEEELFLTAWLWEEGKHAVFFRRFLDEVAGSPGSLDRYHTPSYEAIFAGELPQAMAALLRDASGEAQARAVVTYTMIVEGVLAETGYHGYFAALDREDLLPGLREGLALVKRDEARHIAYGIYLLARLVQADPALWDVVEARMNELLPAALGVVEESFAPYDLVPFGLVPEEFVAYATGQFQKRYARIERARTASSVPELELEDDEE